MSPARSGGSSPTSSGNRARKSRPRLIRPESEDSVRARLPQQSGHERLRDALVEILVAAERLRVPLDELLDLVGIRVAAGRVGPSHAAVVAQESLHEDAGLRRDHVLIRLRLLAARFEVMLQDENAVPEDGRIRGDVGILELLA